MHRSEVARPTHGHLISAQVVDQRLYVGEDTLGVGLIPHDHHVLHLHQRHALGVGPEEQSEIVFTRTQMCTFLCTNIHTSKLPQSSAEFSLPVTRFLCQIQNYSTFLLLLNASHK